MTADPGTVLVTGAAARIGRAITLDLARAGWAVAIHYNSSEAEAQATAEEARKAGARVALVKADLGAEAETADLVSQATAELGPLTALVNSASLFEYDDWQSASRESWDRHLETNLRAPFVLAQEFARALPTGVKGAIVNLIDQRVLKPTPQFMSYALSKAGLHWLTVTLAQALAPHIRVNAVAPGPVLRNARQSEADFARQRAATILGCGAAPDDVCGAVRYLLDAPAVTGQMIAVDGGQHLIWQTPDVTVRE
ncbi:MAG: SDR family oxidoreductase [Alphaproteobacteria bacterium]|nr:SDR family oxidoreductase [Alphaproteobacteria bacterium]MDE2013696.1 SDR family oxidoreductase [Alphaproteobacteria bacterium]MDE2073246.1 SDR family oxidoreductase [Alphaproteobacteria bacterium]MDE2352687.1 SDR family oxidoreductase [Alphaproteobacteria bacterium]